MSFCQEVKKELCKLEEKRTCCEQAKLYGMLSFSKSFPKEPQVFVTENQFVAQNFAQSLAGMMGTFVTIRSDLRGMKENTPLYAVLIENPYQRELLCEHFSLSDAALNPEFTEKSCCTAAFLRGLFLLSGAVTNPEKEYHLELAAPNRMLAEEAFLLTRGTGLRFKLTRRKHSEILYLKESEQIEDFLTLIGCSKFALQLMDVKVMKDIRNKVNRVTNCETANLDKTVLASSVQVQDIRYLEAHGGLSVLDDDLRELARLRLENPELSLRELSELLPEPLSRSGVNHRLKRISAAAQRLRERERDKPC